VFILIRTIKARVLIVLFKEQLRLLLIRKIDEKLACPGGFPLCIFLLSPGRCGCRFLYPTETTKQIKYYLILIGNIFVYLNAFVSLLFT